MEEKSSLLLQEQLKKEGFQVQAGIAGIPTAFVATYGAGKPVIGILGEYDALPGLALTGGTYYTGKQYSDEANQHSLPSFTTFDAGARYRAQLSSDNTLTLRTNISNLANKEYWLSSHYLGAPRTLTFSAQLEF